MAEALDKETQVDKQPEAQQGASSRVPAILVSLSALAVISGAAAYALPNFNRFAEEPSPETASSPIPDPLVGATLKHIQSRRSRKTQLCWSRSRRAPQLNRRI